MRAMWNGQIVDASITIDENALEDGGLAVIRDEEDNELGEAVIQAWGYGEYSDEPLYFIELPELPDERVLKIIRTFEKWYGATETDVALWAVEFQLMVRMLATCYKPAYLLINPRYLEITNEMWMELAALCKYPPNRPINANGVCYTDKLCNIKSDCSKCKNLNPNGTLEDLKSEERKAIGSWLN